MDKDKLIYELKEQAAIVAELKKEHAKKLDYDIHLNLYIRSECLSTMLTILFTSGVLDSSETEKIREILDGDDLDG